MRFSLALLATMLLLAAPALADDGAPPAAKSANCSDYRSKRAEVPVFAKPDPTSRIVSRLALGTIVCYIGERSSFAIVEWQVPPDPDSDESEPSPIAYIRLSDLWAPGDRGEAESGDSQLKEYYRYRQTGTAPDDPLWLLRPFLRLFGSGDPCVDPTTIGCEGASK